MFAASSQSCSASLFRELPTFLKWRGLPSIFNHAHRINAAYSSMSLCLRRRYPSDNRPFALRRPQSTIVTLSRQSSIMGKLVNLVRDSGSRDKELLRDAAARLYVQCSTGVDFLKFVSDLQVPDSFDAYFRITCLHMWLCLFRLSREKKERYDVVKEQMIKLLWFDMDKRLKDMPEITLPTQRRAAEQNLYNNMLNLFLDLDEGFLGSDMQLASGIWRSVYLTKCEDAEVLNKFVRYLRIQAYRLAETETAKLLVSGFPDWFSFVSVSTYYNLQDRMKIVSWNVNGLRSLQNLSRRKKLSEFLDSFDAEILCFQESKLTRSSMSTDLAHVDGFLGVYSFCRVASGYSGVVTFCKTKTAFPVAVEEGLSSVLLPKASCSENSDFVGCYNEEVENQFSRERLKELDSEGRAVLTKHKIQTFDGHMKDVCVINVYCPCIVSAESIQSEDDMLIRHDRLQFKLDFFRLLEARARSLLASGCHVIIVGDLNCALQRRDHCEGNTIDDFELQESRVWLSSFLSADSGFVDAFRQCNPEQRFAYTCWNTRLNARSTNYGTRIDYILSDSGFAQSYLSNCIHLTKVLGSDHCPVEADFKNCQFIPQPKKKTASITHLCPQYWPEFCGKQTKLTSFFVQRPFQEESVVPASAASSLSTVLTVESMKRSCETSLSASDEMKRQKLDVNSISVEPAQDSTQACLKKENANYCSVKTCSLRTVPECASGSVVGMAAVSTNTCEVIAVSKPNSEDAWKKLFRGPEKAPLCREHGELCVLRTVKKSGPNKNRQFWACARAEGAKNNHEARCDFFQWTLK